MAANPVVIIGGGIAGLTTAAYLAQSNVPVTLFEQHVMPGGYVSAFHRERFVFPAGPSSFCSNGIVFPILKELGLDQARRFVPVRRQLSWGQTDVPLHATAQIRQGLAALFPEDAAGLDSYFGLVDEGIRVVRAMEESGLFLGGGQGGWLGFLAAALRNPRPLWYRFGQPGKTNRSLHARHFRSAELRALLDQLGYPVMAVTNTLGMWQTYLNDYWVPVGGMQAWANTFVHSIRQHGGEVRLGAPVRRILVEDGAAAGVELDDGSRIPARAVVSAADLRHTCLDLIGREHLSEALVGKLEHGTPSETPFSVYLGLTGDCSGALSRFQEGHVLFRCSGGETLQLMLLSRDDPTAAPAGKHALCIGNLTPYDQWQTRTADYQARKEAEAWRLIRLAEEFMPGLSQYIEVMDAATPLTYERYTRNWRGASIGWNWDPALNPHIDFRRDFGLRNFQLVGHWRFIPGGIPSAMITARYIARDLIKQYRQA